MDSYTGEVTQGRYTGHIYEGSYKGAAIWVALDGHIYGNNYSKLQVRLKGLICD